MRFGRDQFTTNRLAALILLLIFRPVRRSPCASTLIAAAVLIGLWLERVWIVLPARPLSH